MNIWTSIDSPAVLSEFASQLNRLRMTPYDKLKELPEFVNDSVIIDDKKVLFTTYRNETENDDIEIVLQVSIELRKRFCFSSSQVSADGFCISPNGEIQTLPKEALYDYT